MNYFLSFEASPQETRATKYSSEVNPSIFVFSHFQVISFFSGNLTEAAEAAEAAAEANVAKSEAWSTL